MVTKYIICQFVLRSTSLGSLTLLEVFEGLSFIRQETVLAPFALQLFKLARTIPKSPLVSLNVNDGMLDVHTNMYTLIQPSNPEKHSAGTKAVQSPSKICAQEIPTLAMSVGSNSNGLHSKVHCQSPIDYQTHFLAVFTIVFTRTPGNCIVQQRLREREECRHSNPLCKQLLHTLAPNQGQDTTKRLGLSQAAPIARVQFELRPITAPNSITPKSAYHNTLPTSPQQSHFPCRLIISQGHSNSLWLIRADVSFG